MGSCWLVLLLDWEETRVNELLLFSSLADEFLGENGYQAIGHERPDGVFVGLASRQNKREGFFPSLRGSAPRRVVLSGNGFFERFLLCIRHSILFRIELMLLHG